MSPALSVSIQEIPLATPFRIARGAQTRARVVVATVSDGRFVGRGECTPYARYGETPEGVRDAIQALGDEVAGGLERRRLQGLLPPGAARNALDCALWDLEAKRVGRRAWELAGLPLPTGVRSARTLSIAAPDEMARAADTLRANTLKVKLGGGDGRDVERIRAIRRTAPGARLIVDANEGWSEAELPALVAAMAEARVALIEQPLPAGRDDALSTLRSPVPICADESAHVSGDLAALRDRYQAVNVKLDKTGGLTEALATAGAARRLGFSVMIGCMVGTSLAMAPALLLAAEADFADVDGPTWLAQDRSPSLDFSIDELEQASPALWG